MDKKGRKKHVVTGEVSAVKKSDKALGIGSVGKREENGSGIFSGLIKKARSKDK